MTTGTCRCSPSLEPVLVNYHYQLDTAQGHVKESQLGDGLGLMIDAGWPSPLQALLCCIGGCITSHNIMYFAYIGHSFLPVVSPLFFLLLLCAVDTEARVLTEKQ